ncbi:Crp/Fnr family transcriptional regulator [Aurantibacter crassamenti]|uniref:Crp/Fnr family transcriptional regulator n=1 Tax=Aurantibacter crassamenti TaxID=1837375 RepID=UPI0019396F16|nr:Crp/Fnr family transcriptional regulator [Aurantibacter crassamenti]MBM1107165.1 Crp/Fnr family transcriptional regulator [Aurantibacter crassamenti]
MEINPNVLQYLASMQQMCSDIKDEDLTDFGRTLVVKEFAAKDIIFDVNYIHEHVVFITQGLARSFYTSENGDEITSCFVGENEFITDYPALLAKKPSNYSFETIEPTTGVFLPKWAIDEGYHKYPSLQKYGRLIAEYILTTQQNRIESFLFKSAKQRYLDVLNSPLDLENRVSQRHLASYIGIERQSLTRIRKQLLIEK